MLTKNENPNIQQVSYIDINSIVRNSFINIQDDTTIDIGIHRIEGYRDFKEWPSNPKDQIKSVAQE